MKAFTVAGATVVIEISSQMHGFKQLPLLKATRWKVTANQKTGNDPLKSLTDGKLAASFGPIFPNGVHNGAYKMDLGTGRPISAITSWSYNQKGFRGPQKLVVYGSDAAKDPGWDLAQFTPLGTIDTTGEPKAEFTAASLRASSDQSLGTYRWIVWAVSPITTTGGGENTAFQEFVVEYAK